MTTTANAYTPLESLILFQSLASQGTEKAAFAQVSQSLLENPLVRNEATFDEHRLEPEALREFCVSLLHSQSLQLESSSRKRKLSPLLAGDYTEKLLSLAERMYVAYKTAMIQSIRDDEAQIFNLLREGNQLGDLAIRDAAGGLEGQSSTSRTASPMSKHKNNPNATFQFPSPAAGRSTLDIVESPMKGRKTSRPPPIDVQSSTPRYARSTTGSPVRPGSAEISPISEPSPRDEPRGRLLRGARGARAGSNSSWSQIGLGKASHTPSQSFASHADEFSIDNDTISRIKYELDTPLRTPDEGDLRSKRGRLSLASFPDLDSSTMMKDGAKYVLTSRSFGRTATTVWNDISQHKHASIFSAPVKERDAPGYSDLIKRPQDLKHIKSALSAGTKAVTAATGALTRTGAPIDSASPGQASTPANKNVSMWIPLTPEVCPPRAIVNSVQMEKELLRMFANAVMFNPDSDSGLDKFVRDKLEQDELDEDAEPAEAQDQDTGRVINDAREMYSDVMRKIVDWRAAEHAAEHLSRRSPAPSRSRKNGKEEDDDESVAPTTVAEDEDTPGGPSKRGRRR